MSSLTNFPNGISVSGYEIVPANKIEVVADLSSATWNTVAAHEIATVSGLCRVWILAEVEVTGDDTSGDTATIALGWAGAATSMIAATEVDDLAAGELWYDATPTTTGDTPANVLLDRIINGQDIGFTIAGEAATAGQIRFHIWWTALESGAEVAAGAGGTFA